MSRIAAAALLLSLLTAGCSNAEPEELPTRSDDRTAGMTSSQVESGDVATSSDAVAEEDDAALGVEGAVAAQAVAEEGALPSCVVIAEQMPRLVAGRTLTEQTRQIDNAQERTCSWRDEDSQVASGSDAAAQVGDGLHLRVTLSPRTLREAKARQLATYTQVARVRKAGGFVLTSQPDLTRPLDSSGVDVVIGERTVSLVAQSNAPSEAGRQPSVNRAIDAALSVHSMLN